MLEVSNVTKRFGGIKAVAECTLDVAEGTITGLIGPNGAGKTTLFNLITGHYRPDSGRIRYQGRRIDGLRPDQIFHRKMYRTFQITREFAQMTVLENLMLIPGHQVGEASWNIWFRYSISRRAKHPSGCPCLTRRGSTVAPNVDIGQIGQ
ncbi:ATP-binding cassette domain-containing protein [Desulfosarcina ovata]|uniref:ABC transporter domain-containing protein n=1 Tax=Desulfosarcina ovata subsp. ovata TaxID=2752305 RepID=A0A5K8AGN4_9BACT|nr:ATP-binding cassette domain-containing protein [Desulfosarcina ovata]BBO91853.1 hypothetical protein DSCOOX_50330 [Desulfosarcina ovata subsp. ovata]